MTDGFNSLPYSPKTPLVDICQHIEEFTQQQIPIRIHYDEQNIWKDRIIPERRQRRRKHDPQLSYRTLHDLFQQNMDENNDIRRTSRLQEQDRWRLECLLAQSLFYLFQSPWLPKAWDLCRIKFTQDSSSCNTAKPYTSCTLKPSSFQEREVRNNSPNYLEASDCMVKFGFLLLQLELGRELKLTEKERDDEYGIDTAIERYIDERSGDIKDPLKRVLKACLDFDRYVNEIGSTVAEDDLKPRLIILKHILFPLKELLELNYATVAKDIPDLISASIEQVVSYQEKLTIPIHSRDFERSSSTTVTSGIRNTAFHGSISRIPSPQLHRDAVAQFSQVVSRNTIQGRKPFANMYQHRTIFPPTSPNPVALLDDRTLNSNDR